MEELTLITEEKEYEPGYMGESTKPTTTVTTVECPICGKIIEIPEYDHITRTDALQGHIELEHAKEEHPETIAGGNPGGIPLNWYEIISTETLDGQPGYRVKNYYSVGWPENPTIYEGESWIAKYTYRNWQKRAAPFTFEQWKVEVLKEAGKPITGVGSSNPSEPPVSTFHSLMLHAVAEMYEHGGIVVDDAKARATPCSCVEYKPGKYWCTSPGVIGALTDEQERTYCNPREIIERPGIKERMARWQECVERSRAAMPPVDGATRLKIYLDSMSKCLGEAGIKE